jgi:hypothetical protein
MGDLDPRLDGELVRVYPVLLDLVASSIAFIVLERLAQSRH